MNQNYFEPNPCYDFNYSSFDQPPQYTIDHQPDEGISKSDIVFEEIKMMFQQLMERLNEENQAKIEEMNQVTHTSEPSRRFNSICYDDDDEYDYEESTIPLSDIISQIPLSIVITTSPPVLPIEDPKVSLIIWNEELNTIPEKESEKFIKSSVEDLVQSQVSMRIHPGMINRPLVSVPLVFRLCWWLPSELVVLKGDFLLLTPLCCDNIHDVTPRAFALAGYDTNPAHQG
nr:hypothetical protein [Tanacetum cinerariifolium]